MNKNYMIQAINEAWKYQFLTYPNPAVGACIVKNDEILSIQAHKNAGQAHAEVNALKSAFIKAYPNSKLKNINTSKEIHEFLIKNHNNYFNDCEIYITLEPCNHIGKTPACSNILKNIKPKKVYIGTLDINNEASGGLQTLLDANIDVQIGLEMQKCKELLYPFTMWKNNKFSFFKLAMRKDASIDGGYITTQKSLNLVHEIRTKLDLLIIGGNTVRTDRPRLDTRFALKENPSDILIYSRKKEFDENINLFKVKNRNVYISDNINHIKSNFTMFEGGFELLKNIKSEVDMLMLFISHKNNNSKKFDINELGFKQVHSYFINEIDEIVFALAK